MANYEDVKDYESILKYAENNNATVDISQGSDAYQALADGQYLNVNSQLKETTNYHSFMQRWNPKDQFSNDANYRDINRSELKEKYQVDDVQQIKPLIIAKEAFDKIREKYGKVGAKDFKEFANSFAPRYTKVEEGVSVKGENQKHLVPKWHDTDISEQLSMSTDTVSQGAREAGSFFRDPNKARVVIIDQLKDQVARNMNFPQFTVEDLQLEVDPYTNRETYFNPMANDGLGERQFINPPGMDYGDYLAFKETALDVAFDLSGYVGGRYIAAPVAGWLAKAIFGKLGKIVDNKLSFSIVGGLSVGKVNAIRDARRMAEGDTDYLYGKDLSKEDRDKMFEKKYKEYYENKKMNWTDASITVAADAMFPVYKFFATLKRTGHFDDAFTQAIEDSIRTTRKTKTLDGFVTQAEVKTIIQRLSDEGMDKVQLKILEDHLNLNIAEASGNKGALSFQKGLEDGDFLTNKGAVQVFDSRDKFRNNAIKQVIRAISKPFSENGVDQIKFGEEILEISKKRKSDDVKVLTSQLENSTNNILKGTLKLPSGESAKVGEEIISVITALRATEKDLYDNAFDSLFDATGAGLKPINLTGYYKQLDASYALAKSSKFVTSEADAAKKFNLPSRPREGYKQLEVNTDSTLSGWHETLKDINEQLLDPTISKRSKVELGKLKNSLVKALDTQYPDSVLAVTYKQLSSDYAAYSKKWNSRIAKDFLKIENGEVKMAGEDVFKQIFKNENGSSAAVVKDLIAFKKISAQVPELASLIPQLILKNMGETLGVKNLARKLSEGGRSSLTKKELKTLDAGFNKYVTDHAKGFELFLMPSLTSKNLLGKGAGVATTGDLTYSFSKQIDGILANIEKIEAKNSFLKERFGLADNFTIEDVFRRTFNHANPSLTRDFMKFAAKDADMMASYRSAILTDMEKASVSKNGTFSEKDFMGWFDKYTNPKTPSIGSPFEMAFNGKGATAESKKLFTELSTMRNFIEASTRSGSKSGAETRIISKAIQKFIEYRAAPPLSPSGRLFHSLLDRSSMYLSGKIKDMLLDPDLLGQLNKLTAISKKLPKNKKNFFGTELNNADKLFFDLFNVNVRHIVNEFDKEVRDNSEIRNFGSTEPEIIIDENNNSNFTYDKFIDPSGRTIKQPPTKNLNLSQAPINVAEINTQLPAKNVADNQGSTDKGLVKPEGIASIKNSNIANDPSQKARYDMAFGDKGIV